MGTSDLITVLAEIIGASIGIVGAVHLSRKEYKREQQNEEVHAASMLYSDLKSIEGYLRKKTHEVNLRYSKDWQKMVAACSFLSDGEIQLLYEIYDNVYDYNYSYKKKKVDAKKNALDSLKSRILGITDKGNSDPMEYISLIEELEKQKSKKEEQEAWWHRALRSLLPLTAYIVVMAVCWALMVSGFFKIVN